MCIAKNAESTPQSKSEKSEQDLDIDSMELDIEGIKRDFSNRFRKKLVDSLLDAEFPSVYDEGKRFAELVRLSFGDQNYSSPALLGCLSEEYSKLVCNWFFTLFQEALHRDRTGKYFEYEQPKRLNTQTRF